MRGLAAASSPRCALLALSIALVAGCMAPLYTWDTHSAATPRAVDPAALRREPVATLGLVAPSGLQGFGPALSQALTRALADAAPAIRGAAAPETVSTLNERGLAAEYADLIAGFNRSGILERERLARIGSALGCRYVLLPGLAAVDYSLYDKFEIWGIKIVRSRVIVLRLWLQLWDVRTGRLLWESAGEVTAAGAILTEGRTVPLDEIARRLWRRMLEEDLLVKTS